MAHSFVLVLKTLIYIIRTLFIIEMRIFVLNPFYVSVLISSVIRQKGKSRNRCFKKTKHVKFSEKRTVLTPWYVRVRIRGYEISIFRKIWRASFSWNTCFEICPFALLPTIYYNVCQYFAVNALQIRWLVSIWNATLGLIGVLRKLLFFSFCLY